MVLLAVLLVRPKGLLGKARMRLSDRSRSSRPAPRILGVDPAACRSVVPVVYVNVISRAAVYGILALSMNVLVGYAGQASLGHAAFLGVGAFASGYALSELGMPFGAAMVVAALVGVVAALVLGGVALRVSGLYLALVTIAFGLFAQETLFNIRFLTGGGAGQVAPRPSLFRGDVAYTYLCIGVLFLVLVFDWRLLASRPGPGHPGAARRRAGRRVVGYRRHRPQADGLRASPARSPASAARLFASIEQIVSKEDFGLSLSISFLLMTVVGGAGNAGASCRAVSCSPYCRRCSIGPTPTSTSSRSAALSATWEPADRRAPVAAHADASSPAASPSRKARCMSWLGGGPFKSRSRAVTASTGRRHGCPAVTSTIRLLETDSVVDQLRRASKRCPT